MRFSLLVILLPLLALGCHNDMRCQRQTAMLRAEIIDLEDDFYLLQSKYDNTASELRSYTGEPERATGESYLFDEFPDDGTIILEGIPEPAPAVDDHGFELNAPDSDSSPDIGVSYRNRDSIPISRITINPRATRGHDVDGVLGDEGIDLLVQTRTANGTIQLSAGELTISIIDPAEPPEHQRIGLWKFLPEETELFFANHELGNRGILLHLPWDQSTPTHSRLTLHVRFVTADGRTLKTSSTIRITPPAQDYSPDDPLIARWTQRDDRWGTANSSTAQSQSSWHRKSDGERRLQASTRSPDYDSMTRPEPTRMKIKAIPAKSSNAQPSWRPIR